jgi:hypothetical protein
LRVKTADPAPMNAIFGIAPVYQACHTRPRSKATPRGSSARRLRRGAR